MLDINQIRTNPEWVRERLLKRMDAVDFAPLLALDAEKRRVQTENDGLRATRNAVSGEIATAKTNAKNNAGGKTVDTERLVLQMQKIGGQIADGDKKIADLETRIYEIMSAFPNLPMDDVTPGGKENNKVVKTFGAAPKFTFKPRDHVELCTKLGLIDYERAGKISGAKSWIYTGVGAMLEWALLNYFIDFHIQNGYTFMMTPHLLNYESGFCAGQFPKFADDVFITNFDADITKSKFLVPTAETALINLHRGEIIPHTGLPLKYAGYSPCYRKEAGSYRTDERGMIRGYQFNKVELFIFCAPTDTAGHFRELTNIAERLVEGLGLHYQTVALATRDMSSAMAKTYDIEVFIPSMNGYKEVSSISACNDYQARRGNIRTKTADGNVFVHTLNASGLATSRLIPAIVEQFQNADGTVTVPPILHKYMHGITTLK